MKEYLYDSHLLFHDKINGVNDEFFKLSAVFPYVEVQISSEKKDFFIEMISDCLHKYYISLKPNKFFPFVIEQNDNLEKDIIEVISSAIQEKNTFDNEVISEIHSQSHTLFNLDPITKIEQYRESNSDLEKRQLLENIFKECELQYTTLHIALRKNQIPNTLKRIKTYRGLIEFLIQTMPSYLATPRLHIDESFVDIEIKEGEICDTYTMIWNIWHNCGKFSINNDSKYFNVSLMTQRKNTMISFVNKGEMDSCFVKFLTNQVLEYPRYGRGSLRKRGLEIIREKANLLGLNICVDVKRRSTSICLSFPEYH